MHVPVNTSNKQGRMPPSQRRRIRVLALDYSIGFGGATKSMALMLRDTPDVDVVVVTSQDPDLRRTWYSKWPTYKYRRVLNYRSRWRVADWIAQHRAPAVVQRLVMRVYAAADLMRSLTGSLRLAWLVRRHRIDLVHLANGFVPSEALVAGRLTGVPVIAHLRGFFTTRRLQPQKRAILPAIVIGDSEAVTRSFVERSPYAIPSQTIYEVVDVAGFDATAAERSTRRSSLGLSDQQTAVAIFGRVVQWKGQLEFVRAMISAMDSDASLVGVIVGDASDGAPAYFEGIKALIRDSGKQDRFRLTGYVENVEPLYAAMDIVVHASIEPEPCGMVVMEAMAARRPVIAANAGGPRELIRDGIDGRLVTPGDIQRLADVVLELAADPVMRARMGDAGYDRARTLFDVPVATAQIRAVYEQLTSTASAEARTPEAGLAASVQ